MGLTNSAVLVASVLRNLIRRFWGWSEPDAVPPLAFVLNRVLAYAPVRGLPRSALSHDAVVREVWPSAKREFQPIGRILTWSLVDRALRI